MVAGTRLVEVDRAFDWIGSAAVDAAGGQAWLEAGEQFDDLYAGTAGVLLGCAEAAAAGVDTARVAAGGRDRLVHLAGPGAEAATLPDDGLFTGWGGVAVALRAWSAVAADGAAAGAAATVTAGIARRVLAGPATDPARYTDVISGDAGLLLALLPDGSDLAVRAAHAVADRLAAAAEPDPVGPDSGRLHWRMTADWGYLQPGFSHGTAGTCYALAAAGRALGRRDLVDIAARGAAAITAAGDQPGGWAVPLTMPVRPNTPAVNYGWCHGPAGTIRLFLLLSEIDPRPDWQRAIDGCLQALRDSGLPERLYPGFWDNLGRCCGTAGVGQALLERYHATGDDALLDWAGALAADVAGRVVTTPEGIAWSNTEHKTTPPDLPPEPGLMQGAAGIAGWLTRLQAARAGAARPVPVTGLAPAWL